MRILSNDGPMFAIPIQGLLQAIGKRDARRPVEERIRLLSVKILDGWLALLGARKNGVAMFAVKEVTQCLRQLPYLCRLPAAKVKGVSTVLFQAFGRFDVGISHVGNEQEIEPGAAVVAGAEVIGFIVHEIGNCAGYDSGEIEISGTIGVHEPAGGDLEPVDAGVGPGHDISSDFRGGIDIGGIQRRSVLRNGLIRGGRSVVGATGSEDKALHVPGGTHGFEHGKSTGDVDAQCFPRHFIADGHDGLCGDVKDGIDLQTGKSQFQEFMIADVASDVIHVIFQVLQSEI